ncbi:neutral/alkaline non-lysosomal ceramidase N-terminal domain-containing protein [Candidatus Latescibacterota bacterium]
MRNRKITVTLAVSVSLFAVLFLVTGCATGPKLDKPLINIGLGETVITPEENLKMRGFARSQVATGTHDELHARTLIVEDGNGKSIALMTLAIIGISVDTAEQIRSGITSQTGIPAENIAISCTHTHAGPSMRGSEKYQVLLVERSIESAVQAWNNREPGRIGIASTQVLELGRARRRLLYGGVHPDPEVCVIKVEDALGNLRGIAFNYGCHPSALDWHNTLYSEDWPYYAIQGIKDEVGNDVWVAYYQSAQGDINVGYLAELSAVGVDMPVRTMWYIGVKGGQMASAVISKLPGIVTDGSVEVDAARDHFEYPCRDSYPVTLKQAERDAEAAKKILAKLESDSALQDTRIVDRARVDVFSTGQRFRSAQRFYSDNFPESRTLEQQSVRIGDAVFITYPGELFSEIALKIKEQSPLEKTYVIGVTAGPGGYLPAAKEFIEGDYEVDGSVYSPKTEQVCIDSSLEMIRRVVK